ncbi:conserved hypothetical protein [Heliomicrobium modesticaldum Ice1]|uniref:DUF116 domain-containing protein n=1 Tax=Heliobacterium modesticaldum (strain ATCC 51547 / Ice1) TaxID=498761 RepID=B0TGT0_HELMI|nr:DUF116 domain-containing protein [Heliomicrobium modesticaldum]ABZ84691.1 conserved hypothetical protein [Heliomicrobium modesticaldum Ice1]
MPIRKRLFIGLMVASFLALIGLALLGWYLVKYQNYPWNKVLIGLLGITFLAVTVLIAFGIGGMILSIWQDRAIPSVYRWTRMAVNILFPMALVIARFFGISPDRLKSSFIEVSNQLVRLRKVTVAPERLMILAPHCLQKTTCPHKITLDIYNCKRCGACPVHDLIELTERYGVNLTIVSGGTWARKAILEKRPQAIVAIACERDLTSGIQDVDFLPVLGILNDRPEGPCCNTLVNMSRLEQAVRYFLYDERADWINSGVIGTVLEKSALPERRAEVS